MIQCQDSAFKNFIQILMDEGYEKIQRYNYNKERHALIKTSSKSFYVVYKRDFFNTFGDRFPEFIKEYGFLDGRGESINSEGLEIALWNNVDYIVFIHPDNFYFIYPQTIKKLNLIRRQDKKNLYYEKGYEAKQEITYSVPIELLKKKDDI